MQTPLRPDDAELIESAKALLAERFDSDRHIVAAALRTAEGKIYTGMSVRASIGRMSVCAEVIVLGEALSRGEKAFTTIVAVWYPENKPALGAAIAPPCGMCRELLCDYSPGIEVLVSEEDRIVREHLATLLPHRCVHPH
ncbi:MAG: cytidine deaminase [Candidatus Peregrinibacteria bacterium]|nr:cytidine deaminase [Candidatus Peregrinibacteria bacterium]